MATLSKRRAALLAGGSLLSILAQISLSHAQQAASDNFQAIGDIEVTATRTEQPVAASASAITVIGSDQIEKRGSLGLNDVLRGAPGLDVYSAGGVGMQSSVFLRGATAGQTLVLIDGIRVGDPSGTDGSADLGGFVANNVERIEVLRGPQSALYGSEAMGGVINIITRQGEGAPRGSALVEGGSYGTVHSRVEQSGASGDWTYSFSVDGLHTNAYPRYGYRIPAPFAYLFGAKALAPYTIEPTNKAGASAQLGYRINEDTKITAGFTGYDSGSRFDNFYANTFANTFAGFNRQAATFVQGYVRVDDDAFGKLLHSRLTLFGNDTRRDIWETEDLCVNFLIYGLPTSNCKNSYQGGRYGAEYQGDLKLGAFGLFTFGAKNETETIRTQVQDSPATPMYVNQASQRTTNSIFAQHQLTVFDRLDLTYSGRMDAVSGYQTFGTWRTTAAYRLEETGTKLRASAGSAAKVPSLYQLYGPYGNPNLKPQESLGFDVGVDQKFFGDRLTLSATYFDATYREMIVYGVAPVCTAAQNALGGCYYNRRAHISGVELAGDVAVVPDAWRVRASYTYMDARDLVTGDIIPRRPHNKGSVSVVYTGLPKLEVEARVTMVGANPDSFYDLVTFLPTPLVMPAYAKFDMYASYKLDHGFSVFGRIENLTDVRYQEVAYYSTPGRSIYGGVKYEW
jgi:vitamin B12 transporter